MADSKTQVVELLRSVGTANTKPLAAISPARYVQHDLAIGDGLAGLKLALKGIKPGSVRIEPVRVFQDGAFVFAHTRSEFFGPKIGFEIFRFEGGLIVEHWDNLQTTAGPNPSGHGMIDGPAQIADRDKTAPNKALVRRFVDEILIGRHLGKLPGYFHGDHYVQHNPGIADGVSSVARALRDTSFVYDRTHHLLGQGNFVLVTSEGRIAGAPTAFYDLFRIENDRIAEHWDVLETIAPKSQWKNLNGKF